jgi:hypothetical protein
MSRGEAHGQEESMTRGDILEIVDALTRPDRMSKGDAVDWLETLESEISLRIEALREEIANEDEEDDDGA